MTNSTLTQNRFLLLISPQQQRLGDYKFVAQRFVDRPDLLLEEYIESYLYGMIKIQAFEDNHAGQVRRKPEAVVLSHLTEKIKGIEGIGADTLIEYILTELEMLCSSIFDEVYEFIQNNPWTVIDIERYVELPDTLIINKYHDFRLRDWERLKETYEKA